MDKRIVDICKKTYDLIIRGNNNITESEKEYLFELHKYMRTDDNKTLDSVISDITTIATTKTFIKRK